jgi:hypothetical protein
MTQQIDKPGVAGEPLTGEAPVWSPAFSDGEDSPAEQALSPAPTLAGLAPKTRPQPKANLKPRKAGSTTVMLALATAVAVGGIGFAAGRMLSPSTTTGGGSNFGGAPQANASGMPAGGPGGGGFGGTITGTVVSVGSDSFTVKLSDGSTVTVSTTDSTTYHAQTPGSSSDLAAGQTVTVQTSGGNAAPGASASAGTATSRTATDVTITTTNALATNGR